MNSDGKKITFGFSKFSKKSSILPPPPKKNKSVELIDCLEGKEIKVKNAIEKVEKVPLIIPIRGDANNIISQIERGNIKSKKLKTEVNDEDARPDSELTIEELAARQLLREARTKLAHDKDLTKVHTLVLKENSTVQDAIEPSMNDYENVPIEDFGLALLRGMGWKEENSNQSKFVTPDIRPKGLGLGGQKIVDVKTEDAFDKNGKQLVLKEGAFAKIVAGSHKGEFCEVQFCDQWTGRIGVKINKTNEIVILNELFAIPITKEDYILESRVINNAKYEQYKEMEENPGHSNEKVKGSTSSSEETSRSKSDYFQVKKEKHISRQRISQLDEDQVKEEYESFDEKISNDYKTEKNKSRDDSTTKFNEKIKNDNIRSKPRNKSDKYNDRTKYQSTKSRDSSEEYRGKTYKTKNRHNSRDSSEEYHKRKYDERTSRAEYRRSRSRDLIMNYDKKKSKSKNRSRSRSSSRDYTKKITSKHKKHSKKKNKNEKSNSDDDFERKRNYTKKYRQRNYSEEESSCEEYHESKLKRNEKSRRKSYNSSESDLEDKNSKKNESRVRTGSHK